MILVYTTTAKTSIDRTQKGFTDMLNETPNPPAMLGRIE